MATCSRPALRRALRSVATVIVTRLAVGALLSSCLVSGAPQTGGFDRAANAAALQDLQKGFHGLPVLPLVTEDPWRRYAAPAAGVYIGWFGKPCETNGAGFSEIYSGGRSGDGNSANRPDLINATLDWVQARLGTPISLFHMFETANGVGDFPVTVATECARRRQLLMVSLSLGTLTAGELANGAGDAVWRNWARGAKAWGKPVILRWGWEAPIQPWARDPDAYKRAWQRMWTIVKQEVGATNVQLAFTPLYFDTGWGTFQAYFPGDAYVDWVGVDDYQPPSARFETTFKPAYDWFAVHAPGKPFMVSEWGMKHASDDGVTTFDGLPYPEDWYCQTLEAAKVNPNIKAFVLYDFDQEIHAALDPAWPGTRNLMQKLLDPFILKQAPVF